MSDTTIINIIQPPATPVQVDVQVTPIVAVNVSSIGEKGDTGGQYKHDQSSASNTWTVNHNLGYKPGGIVVKDSAGSLWLPGGIEYVDNNSLILTFSGSFGGTAYIS